MSHVFRSLSSNKTCNRLCAVTTHMIKNKSVGSFAPNTPTAGIIVIGDEILKGHVHDTNSHFLCQRLFSLGVKVKKISVIPDDLDTISEEVAAFSKKFTHVITSGGIGPTHDDVTFEGVAKAFGDDVYPHPDLVALCKEFFGTDDLKSPKLKLAFIPKSARVHYGVNQRTGEKQKYPLVSIQNVFVFPGVPKLMERAFIMLEDLFRNPDSTFHVQELYVNLDEVSIAGLLNDVDARFRDKVILGSYPDFYNSYYKVKLTLESEKAQHVEEACAYVDQLLPQGSLVQYDKDPVHSAVDAVYSIVDSAPATPESDYVRAAVKVIEDAFDKYSLNEICIGFNGGKDCTALLHLVYAVLRRKFPNELRRLKTLYIRRGQPFPEIELFIKHGVDSYRLDLITLQGRIKDVLGELKTAHPDIKAVIMGTRRSDPHSDHLSAFSMTDPGWPQLMRVNPMLDWGYTDVWAFIRRLNLPYCSLYDRGYTSLGSMENTHPNPALQQIDSKGIVTYSPAYKLTETGSERAGRN